MLSLCLEQGALGAWVDNGLYLSSAQSVKFELLEVLTKDWRKNGIIALADKSGLNVQIF
jgi:hypothetical protein